MKLLINNSNSVLFVCLNLLRWVGFLVPDDFQGVDKFLYLLYFFFWFMLIAGTLIVCQTISLFKEWGDVHAMTSISFLLFTILAFACKIGTVVLKKKTVQGLIDEGERELTSEERENGILIIRRMNKNSIWYLCLYATDGSVTLSGWIITAVTNGRLPFLAWYPYDTTKFPGYHLTFTYQVVAVFGLALMNVSLDFVVTILTAICRCRLQLINLSLRNLCEDINITNKLITAEEEEVVHSRLRQCVEKHQLVLEAAARIQSCFTTTILAQFLVSIVILCATAYQMAFEASDNILSLIPMTSYIIGMTFQVFIYCIEAHQLTEESSLVSDAVYCCPWYACSVRIRTALLIMMVRARRVAGLTAGGFATLSLTCFVSIIRVSYSFFTVLKQMEE